GRKLDARTLAPADEVVNLPEARPPGRHGPDPRVRPVRSRESGRTLEGFPPLRHDERPRCRPVVPARALEGGRETRIRVRGIGRAQEVAEELARAERRSP